MSKTILVTGATGFIGSHLVEKLLSHSYQVVILKRSTSNTWRLQPFLSACTFFDLDCVELSTPFKQYQIESIIHLATHYGRDGELFSEVAKSNIILPLKLCELALSFQVKSFIHADTFLPEHYQGLFAYSLSKKQCVSWLKEMGKQLPIINLKLEHPYGEKDRAGKFIPWVIEECLKKVPEMKLTPGEQERDFIYVGDVVQAFYQILAKQSTFSNQFYEYEIGGGETISIKEMVQKIKVLAGNTETLLNFGALSYRESEVMESKAKLASFSRDMDWKPSVSLTEGLKKTIEWYQKEKNNDGKSFS